VWYSVAAGMNAYATIRDIVYRNLFYRSRTYSCETLTSVGLEFLEVAVGLLGGGQRLLPAAIRVQLQQL
jgi:hypothetical protein